MSAYGVSVSIRRFPSAHDNEVFSALPLSRSTVDRDGLHRSQVDVGQLLAEASSRLVTVGPRGIAMSDANKLAVQRGAPMLQAKELVLYLGNDDEGAWLAIGEKETPGADDPANVNVGVGHRKGPSTWANLRDVGTILSARDAGLATAAVSLFAWHTTHTHCPRCGTPTEIIEGGWVRSCPNDGSLHYPRTDPAVIMAILDDDDRLLLGHSRHWPAGRYSTLAGFVESGESLEAAIRREVYEEVGVVIGDVNYAGSQPWPFPASLMCGFFAQATTVDIVPHDEEVTDARWFTREELLDEVRVGHVRMPMQTSIARALIQSWLGSQLPDGEGA